MRVIVHNQLQYGHRTVLKGVRQVKHARNCGALSGQCLLSFCDSNGPIVFEQPQIQNIKWPAGRGDTTCAVGFGGASQAEIINGTFTDNDIGSVLRVFGNSSVTITGTRIKAGTGGITAGAFECIYQHLWISHYTNCLVLAASLQVAVSRMVPSCMPWGILAVCYAVLHS